MQDFPQELVHQVVDNLSDDPKCLRACRLVCRAWNISASAYLFRSLDLSVPNPTSQTKGSTMENLKRLSDLVQILQTSRDIPYCTKEVTLGRTSLLAPETDNHIAYGRLLLSIFSHLPNISALFLREINWLNLDPSKAHILDLCRTPTLQSIDVWNCQFPCVSTLLDFLFSCKGIESLRLTHIRILNLSLNADHDLNTIVEKDTQLQNRNTLQSLAIDSMPIPPKLYTLLGTKGVIDFTRLRRLCLNNVTDPSTIRECLESSGKFLEHLELRTSPFCRKPSDTSTSGPDLSLCPNLQHLRISGLQWTPSLCPAESLAVTFANVTTPTYPLESIHLFVVVLKPRTLVSLQPENLSPSLFKTRDTNSTNQDLDYGAWASLDHILSGSQFIALKKLHLHVNPIRAGDVDFGMLLNIFTNLRDQGVDVHVT